MNTDVFEMVTAVFGPRGNMVSGSKSLYCFANPTHRVFFNAAVAVGDEIVWNGDVDLDTDETAEKAQNLANKLRRPVYVIRESIAMTDGWRDLLSRLNGTDAVKFEPSPSTLSVVPSETQ